MFLRSLFVPMLLSAGLVFAQEGLPPMLEGVGIDQRLNRQVPLELRFRDEAGRAVELRQYFGRKPVVLSLVYYECPMLCTLVLNGMLRTMRAMPLNAGRDFDIVTVSFDPREKPELAAVKKQSYIEGYGRAGAAAGWHFLTGDQEPIRRLTEAAGFRYKYDPTADQFVHASAIMVLTPEGRIARYLYGIEYSARDLRLALVEASAGKIGSPVDQVLLYCFHYDPRTGKYGLLIMNVIRAAGTATVLVLGTFLLVMFRRDRQKRPK
jgi:protein SCO1/2